jgi:DNA-binding response OmpR family regulator
MAKILVVEDSPTVASAVECLLRLNGYAVYTARDGLSALASVRAFLPDLILLDILLPHVDGFELCAAIRQNPNYQALPIIMMTALKDETDIRRAYDVGASDYVTKPFREEDLLATVEQHLAKVGTMEHAV